jgi:hypothetical protein
VGETAGVPDGPTWPRSCTAFGHISSTLDAVDCGDRQLRFCRWIQNCDGYAVMLHGPAGSLGHPHKNTDATRNRRDLMCVYYHLS